MNVIVPAAEKWEAVYYSNPIPLSSRSLLAFALLFDRVHFPGLSIPQIKVSENDKPDLRDWLTHDPEQVAYQNLGLWAMEQPKLADFVHLPDQDLTQLQLRGLEGHARQLLEDTYGEGVSTRVTNIAASQSIWLPNATKDAFALTWPFYQARALQHSTEYQLPLVSDDPTCIPPFPEHPTNLINSKSLAQQLAVEALSLLLPPLRSVEPNQVAEFRSEIQPLVQPFRREMVKMTAELSIAIASGVGDEDLRQACRRLAESRVLPALQDLSKQLTDPLKPFHKIAIDLTEAILATASSSISPALVVGWAILRGAKIASEYARLYVDREGKKKTGLSYLLKIHDRYGSDVRHVSKWDQRDWRCSGFVDVPEPGFPLTPANQAILDDPSMKGWRVATVRRIFQTKTMSFVKFAPPGYAGPWPE